MKPTSLPSDSRNILDGVGIRCRIILKEWSHWCLTRDLFWLGLVFIVARGGQTKQASRRASRFNSFLVGSLSP